MKRHRNEMLRSNLANSGRIAGSGISYDRYDDEAILESHIRQGRPVKITEREEEAKRTHASYPVTTYRLEKEQL